MRWVTPGRFIMGSPETEAGRWEDEKRHEVILTSGFWLAETPCTQELWRAVTGENPGRFDSAPNPVENVSWSQCQEFLDILNQRVEGLDARLPTEAEWEYAARAATETATYAGDLTLSGNEAPEIAEIAWYDANSGGKTHPVGLKRPNPWGFHDMLGNVWEWVEDACDMEGVSVMTATYESNTTDPLSRKGSERVFRGGSWYDFARFVRAAARFAFLPVFRIDFVGFRLARGQGRQG